MQRKLHPLEGIVAVFALVFVLFITIGFAQAQEAKPHKAVYLRSSSALVLDADTGEIVIDKNASRFVYSSGLSPHNVSSARDLVKLVRAAHEYSLIREFSTKDRASVKVADRGRPLNFHNTNGLVRAHHCEVGLSKTGYISEAGRCLVMRVRLASRDLIVVLLDSWGRQSRIGDANRVKKWVETNATAGRSS